MRHFFLFFASLILSAITSAGQNRVEITGRVMDTDSLPVSRVNIVAAGKDTVSGYTNKDGIFSLYILPSTDIEISASHTAYKTYRKRIEVSAHNHIELFLSPNSELLNESVIIARSGALLSTSETGRISINTEKLTQIPSVLGVPDIIKVLQLMPGVQNSGEANGYLYVRGAEPGHNLMMYDDAPVYGMSHLLGIFPFYNTDHIRSIQFDKSGVNAKYGNRLSAALQVLSPNLIPERFSVKGNIGLVASQLSIEAPIGKKAGLFVSGRQTYIDQIITPLINSIVQDSDSSTDDLAYSFTDGNFTFLVEPAKNHRLSVNAFVSGDNFGIAEEKMLLDGKMKWSNYNTSAAWQWFINSKLKLKQAVYLSKYNNKLSVSQASISVDAESKVIDWGTSSELGFDLFNIPFEAGLQFSRYNVQPQEIASNQLGFDNIKNTNNTVEARQTSLFLQAVPQLTSSLYADLGIRLNYYKNINGNSNTFLHAEPRISLNYVVHPQLTCFAAYSRKNQYLYLVTTSSVGFPTDFWIASSAGVPSQSANNFSVGSVYKPVSSIELNANLFYSQLHNLVEYPFSILQFNEITSFEDDVYTGEGRAYGAELMLKKTGRLSGWISYTLSRSERRFAEINNNQTYPAKSDRLHNLSVVANYKLSEKWSAGITQVYSSGSRFTVPVSWYFINNNPVKEYGKFNGAKMPDYIRTDVSVDFTLKKTNKQESVLNLSVYNLFAVNNPIYVSMDISPNTSGNKVAVVPRYKKLYSVLPSVGWRFKF